MNDSRDERRALPSVDRVLRRVAELSSAERAGAGPPEGAAELARELIDAARAALVGAAAPAAGAATPGRAADGGAADEEATAEQLARQVLALLARPVPPTYPRVVNATGILLHTGLGRAPLGEDAAAALAEIATGYSLLEVDPETGERKDRESRLLADLAALCGGESATVVNNNAAALLLSLSALAAGREVLVSRGELIEIGGGFRLPELMQLSGARLVEVGTTNRTYAQDYAAGLSDATGLILRVHTSNYRIEGFQHSAGRDELVELARRHGVPLLEDLGSGLLRPAAAGPLADEPDASSALAAGVDLLCFSGDKLLGGPQAGLLVGRAALVAACRRHPFFRAVRPDRLQLAALGATLSALRRHPSRVPAAAAFLAAPRERLERARALAEALAARFPGAAFRAELSSGSAGSGSLPAREIKSAAVELRWPGLPAEELARRLRTGTPLVFPALWRGLVRLDVLALRPGDEARLEQALASLPPPAPPAAPGGSP
jgi:L-seryl-tRNA(Ser) seleniumtransferase